MWLTQITTTAPTQTICTSSNLTKTCAPVTSTSPPKAVAAHTRRLASAAPLGHGIFIATTPAPAIWILLLELVTEPAKRCLLTYYQALILTASKSLPRVRSVVRGKHLPAQPRCAVEVIAWNNNLNPAQLQAINNTPQLRVKECTRQRVPRQVFG